MNLLELASLVITPNAYKEGKLFSVIPSNGTGGLDVVRATTKTRVNPQGLIEDLPYNLLRYSEDFENVGWSRIATGTATLPTVVANNALSPEGKLNADTITFGNATGSDQSIINQTINLSTGEYTLSVYLKSNTEGTKIILRNGSTNSLLTLTNQWVKYSLTATSTSIFIEAGLKNQPSEGATNNQVVLAWGAQFIRGSIEKPYFPTTDRLNVPSIDYTDGGCPSILLEPQTTNLNTFSEDFTDASYQKTRSSISSNVALSPDGNNTADKLIATTDNNNHQVSKTYSNTVGSKVSFSVFVKKSELIYCQLRITDNATNNGGTQNSFNALYDLQNGVITSTIESGVVNSLNPFTSIKSFGNDWYRCEIGLKKSSNQVRTDVSIFTSNSSTAVTNPVYVGNNVDGFFIFGQQIEERAATSYIPTVGSAVTRNADVISKTGISDLINSQEGSFFIHVKIPITTNQKDLGITDGTSNNYLVFNTVNLSCAFIYRVNGITQASIQASNSGDFMKLVGTYKQGQFKLFKNGVKVNEYFTGDVSNIDIFNTFSFSRGQFNNFEGNLKEVQLYKTALSDEECILLTSTSYFTYQEMATALNYVTQ
tara:strand:+ start:943 stop:2733 length:1791 start_codon:yes stop_codon:yes gene_type:complete